MNKSNNRKCPVCGSKENSILFSQKFTNNLTHNISSCKNCRFVFVRNIPNQSFYNEYYKNMSKYEIERDHILHEVYLEYIEKYCGKKSNILDIGCSTGHLLYLLKKKKYINVDGIDPSPICKKIAMEKFNIKIITANIFSFTPKKKYDFIIFSMVFEHLEDIKGAIKKTKSFLTDNGYVFVSVPDAENFYKDFDEPFGEFSTEHINFFSSKYIYKLMEDFSCVYLNTDNKNIYSVWSNNNVNRSVKEYIKRSKIKLAKIKKVINACPKKIIVWGAGSLTQRLLVTTALEKKVVYFIDSDEKLHGKIIQGKKIISPNRVEKYSYPVLISSFRFRDEIVDILKKKKITNKIITLDI